MKAHHKSGFHLEAQFGQNKSRKLLNITIQARGGLRGWAQAFQATLDPTSPPDPAQPGVTQNTSPKNKIEKKNNSRHKLLLCKTMQNKIYQNLESESSKASKL